MRLLQNLTRCHGMPSARCEFIEPFLQLPQGVWAKGKANQQRTIEAIRVRLFPTRSEILLFVDLETTRVVLEARTFHSAHWEFTMGLGCPRRSLLRSFAWMSIEPLVFFLLNLRRMVLETDCF